MKGIVYWTLLSLLLIAEAVAVVIFVTQGTEGYQTAFYLHITVAVLFGIVSGIHRRAIPVALLGMLVIGTNPVVGILTMILIDDKFNREARKDYFASSENFAIGNPFNTTDGTVEIANNEELVGASEENVLRRVMIGGKKVSEREVEVLSSMRSLATVPLLEKISSVASGEGRVLAQAAVSELSEHASVWAANLHRLEIHRNEIPASLILLAAQTYLDIRRTGRSPHFFGLPEPVELINMLHGCLTRRPNAEVLTALSELLIHEDRYEEAGKLIEANWEFPGFNSRIQQAKLLSARGDWLTLVKLMPEVDAKKWQYQSENVKTFWGINNNGNSNPVPNPA